MCIGNAHSVQHAGTLPVMGRLPLIWVQIYLYPFPLLMQATIAVESKAETFYMIIQQNEIPDQIKHAQHFIHLPFLSSLTDQRNVFDILSIKSRWHKKAAWWDPTLFCFLGKMPSIRMGFLWHDTNMPLSHNYLYNDPIIYRTIVIHLTLKHVNSSV